MVMRIALFLLTNLAVIVVFGLLLNLTGIKSDSIQELLTIALLFGFSGSFASLILSKWIALKSVKGEIIEQPRSEMEHWLINTATQQAKKTNIAIPQVAVYDASDMNAFATGACRNFSLIAISTGMLQNMNRNEIEAVIAHEISHINNGDMVTMTLIQGVINSFVIFISRIIAQIVASLCDINHNEKKEENNRNNNFIIYRITTVVFELMFGILASVVTMWFSRYREFHADAGSAKLVGREKMIAALQCLRNSCEPQEATDIITFCINGKKDSLSELFMTHPSINKRIEALLSGKYRKY